MLREQLVVVLAAVVCAIAQKAHPHRPYMAWTNSFRRWLQISPSRLEIGEVTSSLNLRQSRAVQGNLRPREKGVLLDYSPVD
jgi:hypothetical protein